MSDMFDSPTIKRLVLTADVLEGWQEEIKSLRGEIERKQTQIKSVEAKIDAARLLLGDVEQQIYREASMALGEGQAKPTKPMTDVIEGLFADPLIRRDAKGVMHLLLRDSEQADRVKTNRNNVYTALSRLTKRGYLVRHANGSYSRASEANDPPSDAAGGSDAREGCNPV